jgi:hypothetical protein
VRGCVWLNHAMPGSPKSRHCEEIGERLKQAHSGRSRIDGQGPAGERVGSSLHGQFETIGCGAWIARNRSFEMRMVVNQCVLAIVLPAIR